MKPKPNNISDLSDLSVTPVKKYASPKYPTIADAQCAPGLLRKLPSRWEKNAKVVAAVGMIGAVTLTSASCGVTQSNNTGGLAGDVVYSIPSESEQEDYGTPELGGVPTIDIDNEQGALAGEILFEIPTEQDTDWGALMGTYAVEIETEQGYDETKETTESTTESTTEPFAEPFALMGDPAYPVFTTEQEMIDLPELGGVPMLIIETEQGYDE